MVHYSIYIVAATANDSVYDLVLPWPLAFSRGGSRGGSLGSNEPPFLLIHSTYWFFVTRPAVFDTQRWRASPVCLLYHLRAIQFNAHAVK